MLAKSDEEMVRGDVEGRVAMAEKEADLAEYRAALAHGTLESDEAFAAGFDALPDESIGLVWVDITVLTDELGSVFEQATQENVELGVDWLSVALSAEDDGLLVAMGARTPDGGDTHYEPELSAAFPPMPLPPFPSVEPRARSTGSRGRSTSTSSRSRSKRRRACRSTAWSTRSPAKECSTSVQAGRRSPR